MFERLTSQAPLRHGEVEVRVLRVSDAKALQALLRDNRGWLARWEASTPGVQSAEPGSAPLQAAIRGLRREMRAGNLVPYGVFHRGELAGQLTVSDITWGAICSAQIGYWISREHAGFGVIPRAVALVIDEAFARQGLHRIEICMRPENGPSHRVVEKLQLRYEGLRERYIFIDGAWRDHHCYAITREEVQCSMLDRLTA